MAFLCPVRIRRGKKKKSISDVETKEIRNGTFSGIGRITGSASIETLVRVGIEKENGLSPDSKMVVLHDFTPCVDDELQVKRGQVVNILYRENDWVYVIAEDTRLEGFIPHSYCTPYNSHLGELALTNVKKKLPRDQKSNTNNEVEVDVNIENRPSMTDVSDSESYDKKDHIANGICNQKHGNMRSSQVSLHSTTSSHPEIHPFFKDPSGRFIVLYTFIARDENDVSVERGEFVTVLNRDDPDWYWIIRSDGQEGFVPSGFVYPVDVIQGHLNGNNQTPNNNATNSNNSANNNGSSSGNNNVVNNATNNSNCNSGNGLNVVNNTVSSNNNDTGKSSNIVGTIVSSTNNVSGSNPTVISTEDDLHYHTTELVMLYDYKAQAPDDLSVRRGDWVYADLNNQTIDGWLWAYTPKTRKYGFIPKAYARPPAMTSL